VVLSLLILLLVISHAIYGGRGGDFWHHSAVVRELATHPFAPGHPYYLSDVPHKFYSPYALCVAWVSRMTGLSVIATLSFAGIINLILQLIFLRFFISSLFGSKDSEAISFYALLFILVLWGRSPWVYSGFFHLRALGYVLPYPSAFATAFMFLSFSVYIMIMRGGKQAWFFLLLAIGALVLLTHPIVAIAMYTGLVALAIGLHGQQSFRNHLLLAGIIILSFLIALAWPYFPFIDLVLSETCVSDPGNYCMYQGVFARIFPALLGLPLLMLRVRSNWRDPMGLMFFGLCLMYLYGGITGHWSYGRLISYIVLILQLTVAAWVAGLESRAAVGGIQSWAYKGTMAVVLLCVINTLPALIHYRPGRPNNYDRYRFISNHITQYDVVFSDSRTSWIVPAFGGKVVATPHPFVFIKDNEARRQDAERFFKDGITYSGRLDIIRKYGVNFILIDKKKGTVSAEKMRSFERFGDIVYSDSYFILIKVRVS